MGLSTTEKESQLLLVTVTYQHAAVQVVVTQETYEWLSESVSQEDASGAYSFSTAEGVRSSLRHCETILAITAVKVEEEV